MNTVDKKNHLQHERRMARNPVVGEKVPSRHVLVRLPLNAYATLQGSALVAPTAADDTPKKQTLREGLRKTSTLAKNANVSHHNDRSGQASPLRLRLSEAPPINNVPHLRY